MTTLDATPSTISINFFWGESGRHAYVDKLLRVCPDAFLYWVLNIVEQNRAQPAFPQTLRHFDDAMRIFLKQQWASMVKVAVWRGHSWPPRAPQTAAEGLGLPSALGRKRPTTSDRTERP